LYLTDC